MAIFIGSNKETNAVQAAFGINWFVDQFLRERIHAYWEDLKTDRIFTLAHCIGIDTGEALITRTGVRGDNDLISVGPAPNVAAKLSDLKTGYPINITKEVFDEMDQSCATFSDTYLRIWNQIYPSPVIGGTTRTVLGGSAISEP